MHICIFMKRSHQYIHHPSSHHTTPPFLISPINGMGRWLGLPNGKLPVFPDIPARRAHIHLESPTGHHPSLLGRIPIRDISALQEEPRRILLAGRKRHLLESAQLLRGRRGCAVRKTDVQLGDFRGVDGAGVLHADGDGADAVEAFGVAAGHDGAGDGRGLDVMELDVEVGVFECGVC